MSKHTLKVIGGIRKKNLTRLIAILLIKRMGANERMRSVVGAATNIPVIIDHAVIDSAATAS